MSAMIFNGRQVDTAIWPQAPGTASNPYDNAWNRVDFNTMLTPGFTKFAGEIAKTKTEAEAIFGSEARTWNRGWLLVMPTINQSMSQLVCFDINPVSMFLRSITGDGSSEHPYRYDAWRKLVTVEAATSGTVVTTSMLTDALAAAPMTLAATPEMSTEMRTMVDRRVRAVLAEMVERITVLAETVGGGAS